MSSITFPREEAQLMGKIPLNKIKELVETADPVNVKEINFSCNGYCTDAVLKTIATSAKAEFNKILDVNLQGCTLVTDVGIKWLVQFMKGSQATTIILDGCTKLTDNSLALIMEVASDISAIKMRSTSIRFYLSNPESIRFLGANPMKTLYVQASPVIRESKGGKVMKKNGHVLIVPHSSVKQSVAKFMKSQKVENRLHAHHETDFKAGDWNVALTELPIDNPLFDVLVGENPIQVMIPFDLSADMKEIKTHVLDTISRVISKEKVFGNLPEQDEKASPHQGTHLPFMDINRFVQQIHTPDGLLTNFPKGEVIGCFYSRQMMTRSHPYFEVECVNNWADGSANEKVGILIGCLFDTLFCTRDPMNTDVDVGGEVESFETEPGIVYGFGIEGPWDSEYTPSKEIKFYCTKNGEIHKGDLLNTNKNIDKYNHYPLVACMGEGGQTQVKFNHMVEPPQDLVKTWEKEKRNMKAGFTEALVIDNDGIMSFFDGDTKGYFISENNILADVYDTITYRILDLGESKTSFEFGLGPFDYNFSTMPNAGSLFYLAEKENVRSNGVFSDKIGGLKKGDELTMKVKFLDIDEEAIKAKNGNSKVEILINGKQVGEFDFTYKLSGKFARCHFMARIYSKNSKVQILNFRPQYREPALLPEKPTVGRLHCARITDDGIVTSTGALTKKRMLGMFMAKTPLTSDMLNFDIKVTTIDTSKSENILYVGLCHSHTTTHDDLGKENGTIGYHSNGVLMVNGVTVEKYKADDLKYGKDDTIGCGIEVAGGKKSLEFTKDKAVKSQQKMTVYFTHNGKRVCEMEFEHCSDGLYPCVLFNQKDCAVQICNFYPESNQLREALGVKAEQDKNMGKGNVKNEVSGTKKFSGCEFTVIGLGKDGADVSGKIQLLQQQLNLKEDYPDLKNVSNFVQEVEKNLEDLDLQKQENYSQLCAIQDSMEKLAKENRIHYRAADLSTGKGHEKIVQHIKETFEYHRQLQKTRYELSNGTIKMMDSVREKLKKEKMKEAIATEFGFTDVCSDVFLEIIRYMHELGQLLLLELGSKHIAVDITYIFELLHEMEKLSAKTMVSSSNVLAISKTCHIWKEDDFSSVFKNFMKEPSMFKWLMKEYLGLLKVPCFRVKTDDSKYVYTTLSSLSVPPVSLRDFWSKGETIENFVVIQCTYSFPYTLPDHIMSLVLSHMTKYGRLLLLTSEGAAFQLGAVQTVILRHDGHMDKGVISVESKCYFPKKKVEPVVELTETNVQEYTWNVFCLYTDIIDGVLKQQKLVPFISRNVPKGLVNMSVGCKHTWKALNSTSKQSVCTLCNQCTSKGLDCDWHGIVGNNMRECGCKADIGGCVDCGICMGCAKELWSVRSKLRPNPSMSNQSVQDIPAIPMDPVAFDEIEFIHLQGPPPNLCLREVNDGTLINVFPGQVIKLAEQETGKVETKLQKISMNATSDKHRYSKSVKDHITIRLSDPQNAVGKMNIDTSISTQIQESRVVYHCAICRELRVNHETGLVCYDSASSAVPVAQLVGPKPFSTTFTSFSIKVMDRGAKGTLVVGVCPKAYPVNRQPGWNRFSIAYHGDDGGIFIESGFPRQSTKKKWEVGDIIRCELLTDQKKLTFFKNDEQIYTTSVNFPRGGYHPCIGMHSNGECMKLLEKEPWIPLESETSLKPTAFDTHKYGNLFISPARSLSMKKISSYMRSWIILHNPSKDKIGYKIIETYTEPKETIGVLDPGDSKPMHILPPKPSLTPNDVTINWIALEKSKTYTTDYVAGQFHTAPAESIHSHRMVVSVMDQSLGDVEELPIFVDLKSAPAQNMMIMEIYKNMTLVDKYWIRVGAYKLEIPNAKGDYFVNNPKSPTFLYPSTPQKGMKVVVNVDYDLAEGVISETYEHGGYSVDYNPKGKQDRETLCFEPGEIGIQLQDWDDEKNILLFKPINEEILLTKTQVPAPPFMITEGSTKALNSLDPDWKTNALVSFSNCSQVITRVTIQEQMITNQSRNLPEWLDGFGHNNQVDSAFAYLPKTLDGKTLTFPSATKMYDDISVHRLCSFADQLLHFQPSHKLNLRVPIHFVDVPGIIPTEPLPVNMTYGCLYSGWVYIALLAHKITLPSHSKIFTGEMGGFNRQQIESLLYKLIQPYASLCSLYAAQVGGLPNQDNPFNGSEKMEKYLGDESKEYVTKFKREPISDTHKLVKTGRMYSCKAHQLSISGNPSIYSKDLKMSYDYFEPYNEVVNAFFWDLPLLPSLPEDFFVKFSNLQCFFLHRSQLKDTKALPTGIANCKELETIVLAAVGVSKLPKDLLLGPALKSVTCRNVLVKSLDFDWPAQSQLTKLVLSGLLISEVPSEIYKLKQLVELNLDYNPITSFSSDLKMLPNLKILSVKGIPWITFEGARTSLTRDQYLAWLQENSSVTNNMPGEDIQKFFNRFDTNKNNELDESEVSHMNINLFFKIPRLMNKKNDENGGIPLVIFELTTLEELYLNFQGITQVPGNISQLQNLQVLSLNDCPLLESISGSVGLIPNINSIRLTSCPSLRTPPNEVVSRGFESIRAYLKRLAGGFTECRRTKLMFVGLGGAGKTSLLQALMSATKKTTGTMNAQLTDGIEIKPWTVKADNGLDITFSTWDFAGQTVYYNTHQFFLSNRAVYMLLWNMRMGFEHAGLDFWLSSVACHAPETPVIVVGTQCDQVPKVDIPEKDIKARYPQITGFHYVSSIKGDGIAALEKHLLEVTLQQKYMGEKIPQVWLNLEKKILAERANSSILPWDIVKDFAMDQGIYDDKDVKQAIKFLDDLGTVQYFDNDFLRDRIVINPQWIVNVMACVVSVKSSPIQANEGRFMHGDIKTIWKDYDQDLHTWLLRLTEEFDLTFPLPKDPINIVPCLLPQEEPKELSWPELNSDNGMKENKMVYKFAYLPAGLFNRAQVRLFQFSDGKLIWKKGSLLTKNRHLALIRQANDSELVVLVQGPRPENVLLLIHEVFESLIEESFHGVTYDFFIPCPDCISKEGTREPSLFKADLIRRAGDLKAPFLQCTKYFHTVSMGHLMELMPEDKDTDFDIHLQHSISALQSINQAMSNDIAILYCKSDLPKDKESTVDPRKIYKDLEESGLSCWFPKMEEGEKIQDLMVAIKNCKVLIALMSDDFEKDVFCNNAFVYALEALKKPFVIGVIRESLDWQKSDLGMKIGQPRMAMIKTPDRYTVKINDLIDMAQEEVRGINLGLAEHPSVFISYCWVNSRQAVQMGTKPKHGSLGYGDPREAKDYLTKKGLKCWVDHEQMGKYGLYHDIAVGLQNCKMMIAFVSDEYVKSEACMMEIRFGVCTMNLPLVVCVVGTGMEWKQSEVGLLMRRSARGVSKVYMQKESPDCYETLHQYVLDCLPKPGEQEKQDQAKKIKVKVKKTTEASQLSYREEYELIQRKFMRHISTMISKTDLQPVPKLIVFDFHTGRKKGDAQKDGNEGAENSPSLRTLRPKTATRSHIKMKPIHLDEDDDNWEDEQICVKLLCEHEEGWHIMGVPLTLRTRSKDEIMQCLSEAAPFLARIYAILRQSSMRLNCINNKKGDNFQNWLEDKRDSQEKDGKVATTFLNAYIRVIKFLLDDDNAEKFMAQLDRCHLPSGKVAWLCASHQRGNRITKLGTDEVNAGGGSKNTLFKEDILFKEYLEEMPEYKELMRKAQREKTMIMESQKAPVRPASSSKAKVKEEEKKEDSNKQLTTPKSMSKDKPPEIKKEKSDVKKKDEQNESKDKKSVDNLTKARAVKDVIAVTNAAAKLARENTKLGTTNSKSNVCSIQ